MTGKRFRPRAGAIIRLALLLAVTFVCAYLFGLYSHARDVWPVDIVRQIKRWVDPPKVDIGQYDSSKHLIAYPGKTEVACPAPAETTAVILAIGQSNAANAGARKVATRYPDRVLNYFDGKCFVAASPLLGATGEGGEFLTLLADDLIAAGTYRGVIIVAAAHGGSPVSRWRRNGDLNQRLLSTLKTLPPGYKVTEVVWHQGEADFELKTSADLYTASFNSLVETLRESGVDASIFAAIATRCGRAGWTADNPTANAQRAAIDNRRIFLGADTDALLGTADRREDKCHLSESGQAKTASAYAQAIKAYRRSP
jgi:hypothetical protein